MPQGSYRHFLTFILRGEAERFHVEVRKEVIDRFCLITDETRIVPSLGSFFCFDSVDGKTLAINLCLVQGVHVLWEPSYAQDLTRHEGPIVIAFRDRLERLEVLTHAPEQLYGFFLELDAGAEIAPFPSFEDEDGERCIVNAREVIYVIAPFHLVEEGRKIVEREMGGDDPVGDGDDIPF